MDVAYIGFGSNCGDREHYIAEALRCLTSTPCVHVLSVSSIYESEPVDGVGGYFFLNGVVKIATSLEPVDLLAHLQSVETRLGRGKKYRSGPRTIDLDILLYGSRILREPNLTIPHPKMTQRSFVLLPLVEIEPTLEHPVERRSVNELLARIQRPTFVTVHTTRTKSTQGQKECCI